MGRDFYREEIPLLEEFNLKVTIQNISNKKVFTYGTRAILAIEFPLNNVLYSNFGADAALTNGIQLRYNGKKLLPTTIKNINDLALIAYDLRIDTDATAVTKLNQAVSRFSFHKFMPNGLRLDAKNKFEVMVQDDLSGTANNAIVLTLQGYVLGKKREKRF